MNRYRVTPKSHVDLVDGSFKAGEEFEVELSEDDERTYVDSGRLEIVPRRYKVIGDSVVDDTPPGETFEAALTVGREALLVAGGHIKRVGGPIRHDEEPEPDEPVKPTKRAIRPTSKE